MPDTPTNPSEAIYQLKFFHQCYLVGDEFRPLISAAGRRHVGFAVAPCVVAEDMKFRYQRLDERAEYIGAVSVGMGE